MFASPLVPDNFAPRGRHFMQRFRPVYPILLMVFGSLFACAGILLYPFIMPPVLDTLSSLLPSKECIDSTGLLVSEADLNDEWQLLPHPQFETFLRPPLAALRDSGESAAGQLYVVGSGEAQAWAVERIYCTGNSLRAMALYMRPGFAGYVDALTIPEGEDFAKIDLGWSFDAAQADQQLGRCREYDKRRSTQLFRPEAPVEGTDFGCGIWARYGRRVVAFEVHWNDDSLSREQIEAIFTQLESRVSGSS